MEKDPDDAGLQALLADAHLGLGDLIKWWEHNQHLRALDHDNMTPVERLYAARAYIIDPNYGYELANEAVTQRPGSPIARLTRGRLLAARALRERRPELTDKAVEDVDSVHWLLESDEKFPAMALTTYVSAGNASRAANDPNWNRHFEAARDVVDHIEKEPSNWEMLPLAHYYNSLEQHDKALSLFRNAARNLKQDELVNQYLALTVELDKQPDTEIVARFQRGELKTFGLAGYGCLRAIEGKADEAAKAAHQIVQQSPRSAVALALAADVLRLARKSDEAEKMVRQHIRSVSGPDSSAALAWVRETLLPYYAEGWKDQTLISRSEKELYSGPCLSGAYWEIGLKRFAENDIDGARKSFRKCVEQRIWFLPSHTWSCAMLKWMERRERGSRGGASLGGESPAHKLPSSSNKISTD